LDIIEGSVQRTIRDVLKSFLEQLKRLSESTTGAYDPYYNVHIPGCYMNLKWSLEGVALQEIQLHAESSKALVEEIPEDEKKPKAKSSARQGRKSVTGAEQARGGSSKYRTDDKSCGMESRAMVHFREKLIEYILSDNCGEVKEIIRGLESLYCSDKINPSSEVEPKSDSMPLKMLAKQTTPAMFAQHIGYFWVVDRSITICYKVKKLNPMSLRPTGLWAYIMMITNFVHDVESLRLMTQVLSNNGLPFDITDPFDNSKLEISPSPRLLGPRQSAHSHQIIYALLKPQMMLYDAFYPMYRSQHKEHGEVNIRNRCMQSIGKMWMKVVSRYGLWVPTTKLTICQKRLKKCLDASKEFDHSKVGRSNETGTNLTQVAAYVCHLLTVADGPFELKPEKLNKKLNRFGMLADLPAYGAPKYVYKPEFQLSSDAQRLSPLANVVLEINDIVELILEGTYHEGTKSIPLLTKAIQLWEIWSEEFTVEYCKEYIQKNHKPEGAKIVETEESDTEEVTWDKRPDQTFRKKMFASTEYKKYMINGNTTKESQDIKLPSKTPTVKNQKLYISRLEKMSTSMMEAVMYLRFQMYLLQKTVKNHDLKINWKIDDIMTVFQKEGGDKALPFYHPVFATDFLDAYIDPEMRELAYTCFQNEKNKAEEEKKPNRKEVSHKASLAGFNTTTAMYDAIGTSLEAKRKKAKQALAVEAGYNDATRDYSGPAPTASHFEEPRGHKRKADQNDDVNQRTTQEQKRNEEQNKDSE
jgi:hypothetical protein